MLSSSVVALYSFVLLRTARHTNPSSDCSAFAHYTFILPYLHRHCNRKDPGATNLRLLSAAGHDSAAGPVDDLINWGCLTDDLLPVDILQ